MLSDILKSQIEDFARYARLGNPLFARASQGKISPRQVARYLANIRYLISHTPVHLNLAVRRAEERGLDSLAVFFREKLGEEEGHEEWAKDDIKQVKETFGSSATAEEAPTEAMKLLVNHIESVIESNPRYYIVYMLVSEYLTVLMAPQWLSDLQEKCGIASSSMSVVDKHATLDLQHVQDDLEEVENLLAASEIKNIMEVVSETLELYDRFARDLGEDS